MIRRPVLAALAAVFLLGLLIGRASAAAPRSAPNGVGMPDAAFRPLAEDASQSAQSGVPPFVRFGDGRSEAGDPNLARPSPAAPTVADARAWALAALGPREYACLDRLVQRESRWNPLAVNRRSGAFGLFQTYPAERLAKVDPNWRDGNPMSQMIWGLGYLSGRYGGSACRALDHALTVGWF